MNPEVLGGGEGTHLLQVNDADGDVPAYHYHHRPATQVHSYRQAHTQTNLTMLQNTEVG